MSKITEHRSLIASIVKDAYGTKGRLRPKEDVCLRAGTDKRCDLVDVLQEKSVEERRDYFLRNWARTKRDMQRALGVFPVGIAGRNGGVKLADGPEDRDTADYHDARTIHGVHEGMEERRKVARNELGERRAMLVVTTEGPVNGRKLLGRALEGDQEAERLLAGKIRCRKHKKPDGEFYAASTAHNTRGCRCENCEAWHGLYYRGEIPASIVDEDAA